MALGVGALAFHPSLALADDLSPEEFRDLVIAAGARRYPSLPIRPTLAQLEVLWGGHHLYLYNAYAAVRRLPPEQREYAVLDFLSHFSPDADARADAIVASVESWDKARPLLRPKLLPAEVVASAPRIVHRPFSADVVIAYSIDLGDKDLYVDRLRVDHWGVPAHELHAFAIENLEAMSTAIPPVELKTRGARPLLHISTNDGYDAARILLPGLRARLVDALGPKVLAGIPGRDLLIVWPGDYGSGEILRKMIRDDAARMPHRLTGQVFVLTKEGIDPALTSIPPRSRAPGRAPARCA